MTIQPRPHQVTALTNLMTAFAVHDRAQLIMACGTGKTLIGRWHAESSDARTVLVLVPSLALLSQTLREWRRLRSWPFDAIVVCSDPTTDAGVAERGESEVSDQEWTAARARVTTDPSIAAAFLAKPAGRPRVVFSTYHSAPVVAAAQATSQAVFDLAICDEAHRLAGTPRAEFRVVLDRRQIIARRRLFMTATTKVWTGADDGYSMDDPRVFGPVAHTVSFGDAIAAGLLCDYQVSVLGIPGTQTVDDTTTGATTALFDAVDRHNATRILTFHGRVAKAARFAQTINDITTPAGRTVRARHLSGSMKTSQRTAALAWLAEQASTSDDVRVISNARILTEGVDVPAVDAICFADQRSSVIDIIQAVGRVLRPHPGKTIGTIIVPIALPADGDDDTELLVSRFSLLWSVLRALRSHDQRFAHELDQAARTAAQDDGQHRRFIPPRVEFDLPDWCSEELLHLRTVQEVGDAWERFYGTCRAWATEHPEKRLPRNLMWRGTGIGEWAAKQRTVRTAGVLPAERIRRLEEIPNWYWDRADAAWDDTYQLLQAFADEHGSVEENTTGQSVFTGLYAAQPNRFHLGVWLAMQRQSYRAGTLEPSRAQQLEALPGWTWAPVPAEDLAMVDALGQFCEFEKHAQVPTGHIEDGLPLGRWCWAVRRRKLTGRLHPALEDEITAATPSKWRSGANSKWQWEKPETQWRIAFSALRQYTEREGHAAPAGRHVEQVFDGAVNIGQWVALQRHLFRKGELSDLRTSALEQLPGWKWESEGRAKPFGDPIELKPGLDHGRAGAIAAGCPCETCRLASRKSSREHKQRRRAEALGISNGLPAARAHNHLRRIEPRLIEILAKGDRARSKAGIGRNLIAATAGVPLSVVREVLNSGATAVISAEHQTRLLAVTLEMCLSNLRASGSRGRWVQPGSQRIPVGPTLTLVDELGRRGFTRVWIGRELGYTNGLQLGLNSCTEAMAQRVASLHQQIVDNDLWAPAVPPTTSVPSLAQIKATARLSA